MASSLAAGLAVPVLSCFARLLEAGLRNQEPFPVSPDGFAPDDGSIDVARQRIWQSGFRTMLLRDLPK